MKDMTLDELGRLLYDESESSRRSALREIESRRDKRALPYLHSALEDSAPTPLFCLLAAAIGGLTEQGSLPVLLRSYQRSLPEMQRLALLRAVGSIPGAESEAFLLGIAGESTNLRLAALEILVSRQTKNITPLLIDVFVMSPLPERVSPLLLQYWRAGEPDVMEALVLRLMLQEGLSAAHMREAAALFASSATISAVPLIRSWSSAIPALRSFFSRAVRRLAPK